MVGLERELSGDRRRRAARRRAGRAAGGSSRARRASRCARCSTLLSPDVAERVIFDLGLVRTLGYYTGPVFEVYDAAFGSPLGGGGRYDDLLGRCRALPAGRGLGARTSNACTPRCWERADEDRRPARRADDGDARRGSTCSASTPPRWRSNDRKLLFEDVGLITMRPSDVPHLRGGRAPRTSASSGKDVLAEQPERSVYELLDLGFGRCRMVFATVDGDDPAAEALRRLGSCGSRQVPPNMASAYFERTGRQVEIVEVKGSVELAPLTGMVARDRRPDGDRHDAARERAGHPRGDLRRRRRG